MLIVVGSPHSRHPCRWAVSTFSNFLSVSSDQKSTISLLHSTLCVCLHISSSLEGVNQQMICPNNVLVVVCCWLKEVLVLFFYFQLPNMFLAYKSIHGHVHSFLSTIKHRLDIL